MPDHQLSLAIGREGQNARLSAKLTGWRIDIKSETQADETGFLDDEEIEQPNDDEVNETAEDLAVDNEQDSLDSEQNALDEDADE